MYYFLIKYSGFVNMFRSSEPTQCDWTGNKFKALSFITHEEASNFIKSKNLNAHVFVDIRLPDQDNFWIFKEAQWSSDHGALAFTDSKGMVIFEYDTHNEWSSIKQSEVCLNAYYSLEKLYTNVTNI